MLSGRPINLIEDYMRQMKKFSEEDQSACGQMLSLDQEVPLVRTADSDFLKTDIKTEIECMDQQQSQLINFFGMEDALGANQSSTSDSNAMISSLSNTIWPMPFCTTTTNSSFSNTDCKDSLNTPTPFCSNSINGLKWEPSVTSMSIPQSPFLSSVSLSSAAAHVQTVSSSLSPSSSLSSSQSSESSMSSSLQSESFLTEVSPSELSLSSSPSFTVTLPNSRFNFQQLPFSRASVSLTSPSSLSSSLSSSGSFLNELGPSPTVLVSTTKVRNITNGLAGSGCTLVSSTENFLGDTPHQALSDDALEYTDLDKQPFSMYEDFEMVDKQQNNNAAPYDPDLETLNFTMMHDTLKKDCEDLNIPFDPMLWTAEHVQCWMSAICNKKNLPDVSSQLYPIDGRTLCSMPETAFQPYGDAGRAIAFEIACCKAATSYMPQEMLSTIEMPQQFCQQSVVSSSCVSPAPSNSSNSHVSIGFSTPSDQSEDEAYFSSASSSTDKRKGRSSSGTGGRSIYLWQFLVELLRSGDPAHADCIRWIDPSKGIFKIEDSKKVAFLWGKRKNRPMMNYDKLSRSVRQYYKKGIIKKTEQSRRLVYQFCESTLASLVSSTTK